MSDAVVFGGMLIDSSALLGINIYALITLSDLECDYLNASTACSKLNSVILVRRKPPISKLILFQARNHYTLDRYLRPFCHWPLDSLRLECPRRFDSDPQIQLRPSWKYR